jgi:hypothetical protein
MSGRGVSGVLVPPDLSERPAIEGLSNAAFRTLLTLWCRTAGAWEGATPRARRELVTTGLATADGSPATDGLAAWSQGAVSRPPIPPTVRAAVYVRDDWTCQLCGLRIPPTLPEHLSGQRAPATSDGTDLTLDHRVPFSLGGPDTVENLRAACRPCNSARGIDPIEEG